MIKKILYSIIIILAVLWQLSFFNELMLFKQFVNFPLVIIIFLAGTRKYRSALYFGVLAGLILDLYSILSFGITTVSFLFTILIIYILLEKFISRVTIYSLLLTTLLSTLFYNLFIPAITNLFVWLNWHNLAIPFTTKIIEILIWQLVINLLLILLINILSYLVKKYFSSNFLYKTKKYSNVE